MYLHEKRLINRKLKKYNKKSHLKLKLFIKSKRRLQKYENKHLKCIKNFHKIKNCTKKKIKKNYEIALKNQNAIKMSLKKTT